MSNQVANEILKQLGGRKFIVMAGVKQTVSSDNGLTVVPGTNPKRIKAFRIELGADDLYKLVFLTGPMMECKSSAGQVPAANLREVVEAHTGLLLSLGTCGR